jgi:hypothetical protein
MALFLLLLSACRREQSLEEAMTILCALPTDPKVLADPENVRALSMAREANLRVTNPEVRKWMQSIPSPKKPDETQRQGRLLLERAHIQTCWITAP